MMLGRPRPAAGYAGRRRRGKTARSILTFAPCRLAVLLLGLSVVPATRAAALQRASSEPAAKLSQQARAAAAAGKIEEAVALDRQAITLDPKQAALRVELAGWLTRLNRPLAAIVAFREALDLDPGNEAAELGLGASFRQVFNYDEARKTFEESARAHPASAAPLLALADLELQLQDYPHAVAHAGQALKLAPRQPAAHVDLAVAYQAQGNLDSALAELNAALTGEPGAAVAYYLRGSLYADRDQNQLALADARKAIELEPANAKARSLVARLEVRAGACRDAVSVLAPLLASPVADAETLYLAGRACQCAGQNDRAQKLLERFAKKSAKEHSAGQARTHADFIVAQAGEAARQNKLASALDLLHQALAEDPGNSKAQGQLAKIYFSAGRIDLARAAIEKALATDPYQPDYLYVRGKVLEQQGDLAAALAAFQDTVLVNPAESDAYYEIGTLLLKQGRREDALAALRQAVALSPGDPGYRRALEAAEGGASPK
ncbi:MAG TPA: tetratricopeptide repeat protein [Terriglobia bacterium]|nr:tetratricopeptide repeat protein [Terriglobia bacterium]